ncbi:hypothetical protein EYR36_012040 [Pleurotus pulmonarius]|nr:hypothetical protein EYR36_012040 [Pleurotus pulmonarius]
MSLLPSIHLKQLWLEDWVIFNDASDVIFILSTCSTTLEELTLNVYGAFVNMTLSMPPWFEATLPTIVRLEALRALQLHDRAILQLPNACKIVCPNLECFTVVLTGWGYWEIPSWVSSSLSELRIRGIGFACVGEFINALPFPGQLQKLTIKITREIQTWDRALRPTPADYEILSKVLDGLLKHGMLERVDLTIVISVLEDLDRQPPDGAAEVVNLEKAFGGLLKAGVLSSDIVIERKSGEVFRRWSVGQRVEA